MPPRGAALLAQFAPYFEEVDYGWTHPVKLYTQTVYGTFMTKAHWVLTTAKGRKLTIGADAMVSGTLNVPVDGVARPLARWSALTVDEVNISTKFLSLTVSEPRWEVNVTSRPIYGQSQKWYREGMLKRFDITIKGAFPQPEAHGIIGQSYRDGVRRDGAQDVYDEPIGRVFDVPSTHVLEHAYAPALVTKAQAEGAIDGTHVDYKLSAPYSTNFTFSRFYSKSPIGPRETKLISGTKRQLKRRKLAKCSCAPI